MNTFHAFASVHPIFSLFGVSLVLIVMVLSLHQLLGKRGSKNVATAGFSALAVIVFAIYVHDFRAADRSDHIKIARHAAEGRLTAESVIQALERTRVMDTKSIRTWQLRAAFYADPADVQGLEEALDAPEAQAPMTQSQRKRLMALLGGQGRPDLAASRDAQPKVSSDNTTGA